MQAARIDERTGGGAEKIGKKKERAEMRELREVNVLPDGGLTGIRTPNQLLKRQLLYR